MTTVLAFLVGLIAGAVTYVVGPLLSRVLDFPVFELCTMVLPFALGLTGNVTLAKWVKIRIVSSDSFLIQPVGFLAVPGILVIAGNEWQVLGAIGTATLCVPAIVALPFVSRWVLRRWFTS